MGWLKDRFDDLKGSVESFVENPIDSLGQGLSTAYTLPGRALGSDALTDLGGKAAAATGGLFGVNAGKAAGRDTGNEGLGRAVGQGATATAGAIGGYYGLPYLMGGGAAKTGATAGGGMNLLGSGGAAGNASAVYGGGAGAGSVPFFGGMQGSAAPGAFASKAAGGGGLFGDLGSWWGGLTGAQKVGTGLGLLDLGGRLYQGSQLNDIAREAADRGDALKQEERRPYQGLLGAYMLGGAPLTDQPMIRAQMDQASRDIDAKMSQWGQTGSGMAPATYAKYMNEALNASAMPYLQQLAGIGGYGFGPGYSGNLYGQYASQATGAPFLGLDALGRSLYGSQQDPHRPIYNAQQQMMGQGQGRGFIY